MNSKKYLDLDILMEATKDGEHVRVVNSPAGNASQGFKLPFNQVELEHFLFRLGAPPPGARPQTRELGLEAAKEFGGKLYQALIGDAMRTVLRKSLEEASRQGAGLRIRLRFLGPGLVDLPWEFLYNPAIDRFLCLSAEMPLVRFQEYREQAQPFTVKGPLRVLVMIAGPVDENYEPVDIEAKWKSLSKATADLKKQKQIIFDCLDEASLPALRRQLQTYDYHVFHFIGHGDCAENTGEGMLVLENEQRGSELASGRDVGILLQNYSSLKLVILQPCEGERRGTRNPFAGAAQSLVRQGVQAVVAMQFAVRENTSATLNHELYRQVAAGSPIDLAIVDTRKAIFNESSRLEWAAPAVFTRSPDGLLFDIPIQSSPGDIANWRPTANLFVRQGAQVGQNFPLQADSYVIGRDESLPIPIQDGQVSRTHAQIIHSSLGFWIEDLKSTNGTYVNGVRITGKSPLRNGDVIRVGGTTLVFDQGTSPKLSARQAVVLPRHVFPTKSQEEKREKIAALWAEAEKALQQGQWEAAAASLQALLNLDPAHSKARSELGSLQKQQRARLLHTEAQAAQASGDWDTAIARLQAILNLEPNNSETRNALHQAQQEQKIASLLDEAHAAQAQENFPLATARLQAMLVIQPNHPQARQEMDALLQQQRQAKVASLYRQGQASYEAGHYWQALEFFYQVKAIAGDYEDVARLIDTIEGMLGT